MFVEQQISEPIRLTEFEFGVHLDRVEGADLDADLTTHTDRDVDIENERLKLVFADEVGFLVLVLLNVDALRGTFLFTDLTSNTAETAHSVIPVEDKEGEVAVVLLCRNALLGIRNCGQVLIVTVTADKILCRLGHPLDDSGA